MNDTSVQFVDSNDGLFGTTINFIGTGMIRDVTAQGQTNWFEIQGAGVSGPSGTLVGDSGTNVFFFQPTSSGTPSAVLGDIQGRGASTLNYAAYPSTFPADNGGVQVDLGNGTDGTATGVNGTVSGITAIIGSAFNDNLDAENVPGVALTGGPGDNFLLRYRCWRQRGGIAGLELHIDQRAIAGS